MNLVNATKLVSGYAMATDKTGREWVVVVAKGTYGIPDHPDREPALLEEQFPLVMTDVFTGEPGFSAPLHEMDFAPRKLRCDVLLNGCAYARQGKPVEREQVTLQVGGFSKTFDVVGNRIWEAGMLYFAASTPEPFTVMPISYNNAFGGVDKYSEDPAKHCWYAGNHAGVGYSENLSGKQLNGKPLPNTEEHGRSITSPNGKHRPMAFGPVARAWQPRSKWAGTYDQKWLDERAPFLPADFDDHFFQVAPEDQQIDYPGGGEEVVLTNLTPQARTAFRLPKVELPVVFFRKSGEIEEVAAVVDTILIEPEKKRFMLVWRASVPLRRSLFELWQAAIGKTARHWVRLEAREERTQGKTRVSSLAELAAKRRQQLEES